MRLGRLAASSAAESLLLRTTGTNASSQRVMWSRSVVLTLHCNLKRPFPELLLCLQPLECSKPFLPGIWFGHHRSGTSLRSLPACPSKTVTHCRASKPWCAHAAAHVKAFCRALGLRPTPVPATSSTAGPGKPVPSLCGTTTATAQTCLCLSCLQGPTALAWPAAAMCSRQ